MRPIAALLCLSLCGCDQIPVVRNLISRAHGPTRKSEKRDVDCGAEAGRGPRDGCVTRAIECGDEVEGHTAGGRGNFDDDFYIGKYCLPEHHGYGGNERVYTLELPANTAANVWLDSDCADLDLFAFRWNYDGRCPTVDHLISECEADASKGGGVVHVETVGNASGFMIAVEGKAGVEAPFRLTVECGGSR